MADPAVQSVVIEASANVGSEVQSVVIEVSANVGSEVQLVVIEAAVDFGAQVSSAAIEVAANVAPTVDSVVIEAAADFVGAPPPVVVPPTWTARIPRYPLELVTEQLLLQTPGNSNFRSVAVLIGNGKELQIESDTWATSNTMPGGAFAAWSAQSGEQFTDAALFAPEPFAYARVGVTSRAIAFTLQGEGRTHLSGLDLLIDVSTSFAS